MNKRLLTLSVATVLSVASIQAAPLIDTMGLWPLDRFTVKDWSQQVWMPCLFGSGTVEWSPNAHDGWMGLLLPKGEVGKRAIMRLGQADTTVSLPFRLTWDMQIFDEPADIVNCLNGVAVGTADGYIRAGQFGNATYSEHRGKFALAGADTQLTLSPAMALGKVYHLDLSVEADTATLKVYDQLGAHISPGRYQGQPVIYETTMPHTLKAAGNEVNFFATVDPFQKGDTATDARGSFFVRNVWVQADSLPTPLAERVVDHTLIIPPTEFAKPDFAKIDAETGPVLDTEVKVRISGMLDQADRFSTECRSLITQCRAKKIPTWQAEAALALQDMYGWITREHLEGRVLDRVFYGALGEADHTIDWYRAAYAKHSKYRMGRQMGNGPRLEPITDEEREAVLKNTRIRDEDNAKFLVSLLTATKTTLQAYLAGAAKPLPAPPRPASKELAVREGQFRDSAGRPVFLVGMMDRMNASAWLEELSAIGYNHMQFDWFNTTSFQDPEKVKLLMSDVLKRGEAHGVWFTYQSLHNFPWDWAPYPEQVTDSGRIVFSPYNILHPLARRAIEQNLALMIPALGDSPAVNLIELSNQPFHLFENREMRLLFGEWAEQRYGSLQAANAKWRTSLASWEEFAGWRYEDLGKYPALKYDWLTWQRQCTNEFYHWLVQTVRKYEQRHHDVTAQVVGDFTQGVYPYPALEIQLQKGLDHETLFTEEINVCATDGEMRFLGFQRGSYGSDTERTPHLETFNSIYIADIYRSLAPSNPLADDELYLTGHQNVKQFPQHYFRSAIWQYALHGASQMSLWKFQEGDCAPKHISDGGTVFDHAAHTWAIGQAAGEIQRYAEIIDAFGRQRAPVAMLYSRTSQFLDWKANVNAQRAVYEALLYSGYRPSFVTEGQLANDNLPYKVIVATQVMYLPAETLEQLKTFVRNGGVLLVMGEAFTSTPYGEPLQTDDLLPEAAFIPPIPGYLDLCTKKQVGQGIVYRFIDTPDVEFSMNLLQDLCAKHQCLPTHYVGDNDGRWIYGIDSRAVQVNGKTYLYVVNKLGKAVTAKVYGNVKTLRPLTNPASPVMRNRIRLEPVTVELYEVVK